MTPPSPTRPKTELAMVNDATVRDSELPAATAVLYVRVSTKEQAERDGDPEGYSIPAQLEACRRKANAIDATVVEEFVERGESARTVDRPEIQRLLRYVRDNQVTHVIVHKIDRLARNRVDDVAIGVALKAAAVQTRVGQRKHRRDPLRDPAPRDHELHRRVLQPQPRQRSHQRQHPESQVRRHADESPHSATSTSGASRRPRNPHRRHRPRRGTAHGICLRRIRDRGMDTPGAARRSHRTWPRLHPRAQLAPRSRSLSPHFHRLLRNPYYMGIVRYRGVLYAGKHEPLVTPETWQTVQELLAAKTTRARAQAGTPALPQGLRLLRNVRQPPHRQPRNKPLGEPPTSTSCASAANNAGLRAPNARSVSTTPKTPIANHYATVRLTPEASQPKSVTTCSMNSSDSAPKPNSKRGVQTRRLTKLRTERKKAPRRPLRRRHPPRTPQDRTSPHHRRDHLSRAPTRHSRHRRGHRGGQPPQGNRPGPGLRNGLQGRARGAATTVQPSLLHPAARRRRLHRDRRTRRTVRDPALRRHARGGERVCGTRPTVEGRRLRGVRAPRTQTRLRRRDHKCSGQGFE